jgi:PAS domain S-box-containing protein
MRPSNEQAPPAWVRYGAAVGAVVVVALLTSAVPILRDRFTFFLFWPLVVGIAWFSGTGPAVLVTALSAVAAALQIGPGGGSSMSHPPIVIPVILFVVCGMCAAWIARVRSQARAALEESHDLFATVANAAPVLIRMSGPDGGCAFVNDPWLEFTGRPLERELDHGWADSIHPEDRDRQATIASSAIAAGLPFEVEYRLRRADGEDRSVLDRGVPRRDRAGRVIGYVDSCTDITEQRRALTAAREAQQAAESANRAKDAFLATVSHELRTPLSPIITWVQILLGNSLSPDRVATALRVIERNARMQAQLVEDLLDVARIVEGKLQLRVRPVRLAEVIDHAVDAVRPAADGKQIELQLVLDTTIAPLAGDPDRLQQVVWNLLSNAVKFTPRGGRVQVVLQRVNSHVEITISDTGVGIGAEQRSHLFERFWQHDSTTTRAYAGLGLGLAIVRHLVEMHGGTVAADSPGAGLGSTFTVKLPIAPIARSQAEPARRRAGLETSGPMQAIRLDGVRVLLVDDEPDSNEATRVLLDVCGAEIRVAGSADLALEVLSRWRPDVLVTDVGMPGDDGYALIAKVRAIPDAKQLPVVALTAYASPEDRARLLSAGFDLHVAKPAEPIELTAAIAAVAVRRS